MEKYSRMKPKSDRFKQKARALLKSELVRRDMDYHKLAEKLQAIGQDENYNKINTKVNRGTFSLAFFLSCMEALGVKEVRLD